MYKTTKISKYIEQVKNSNKNPYKETRIRFVYNKKLNMFLMEEKYGYLINDDELDTMICGFSFILASQELYPLLMQ